MPDQLLGGDSLQGASGTSAFCEGTVKVSLSVWEDSKMYKEHHGKWGGSNKPIRGSGVPTVDVTGAQLVQDVSRALQAEMVNRVAVPQVAHTSKCTAKTLTRVESFQEEMRGQLAGANEQLGRLLSSGRQGAPPPQGTVKQNRRASIFNTPPPARMVTKKQRYSPPDEPSPGDMTLVDELKSMPGGENLL